MKKLIAILIGVLLIGGVAYTVTNKDDAKKSDNPATKSEEHKDHEKAAESAKFTDACKVITSAQLQAAFGVAFDEGKAEKNGSTSDSLPLKSCTYEQTNDGSVTAMSDAINFSVQVETYHDAASAETIMKTTKSTDKLGDKVYFVRTDVDGVGDEAFFFQGQAPVILKTEEFMYARSGNQVFHFVAVRLSGINHETAKTAITTLAKDALND